jgi:hypothetical protein
VDTASLEPPAAAKLAALAGTAALNLSPLTPQRLASSVLPALMPRAWQPGLGPEPVVGLQEAAQAGLDG